MVRIVNTVRKYANKNYNILISPATVFVIHLCLVLCVTADITNIEEKLSNINSSVNLVLETLQIPGLAAGIIADGRTLAIRCYGVLNHSDPTPVNGRTIFAIGSCTKAFTTFVLGQLVDEGRIDWDDRVISHIPEFQFGDSYTTRHIKIKDLITHRSGLPSHLIVYMNAKFSREQLLEQVVHLQPSSELREKFQYNNLMYVVAGIVSERVTGQSWETLVRNRIFKPLDMMRSNCSLASIPNMDNFAVPHSVRKDELVNIPWYDVSSMGPAGSIVSTAEDMVKWIQVHQGVSGRNLIREGTLNEMHVIQMATPTEGLLGSIGYGFGWLIRYSRGRLMVYHTGMVPGYKTHVALFPEEKIGIVLLTNSDAFGTSYLDQTLIRIVDILLDQPVPPAKEWASSIAEQIKQSGKSIKPENYTLAKEIENPEQYTGQYENPGYKTIEILLENDQLFALYNEYRYTLRPKVTRDLFIAHCDELDSFLGENNEFECAFLRDTLGDVDECRFNFEPKIPFISFERIYDLEYLKRFEGTYQAPGLSIEVIINGRKRLIATVPGYDPEELRPRRQNVFYQAYLPNYLFEFIESNGTVSELHYHQAGSVHILKVQ